ncbi:hypothetical protein ETB97_010944, partial [Aspergillus alliaceus]
DDDGHRILPPAYARRPGFIFPLTPITNVGVDSVALDPNTPESIDILKQQTRTGLDHGQCQGLIAALTRGYDLIQGPPGTGKSYVGVKLVQALLEVKRKAELGPIVVICYTNHALNQFLKHLLDVGIQKIIRIGGRSQATELEGKNLRLVSKGIGKTRTESQTLGKSYDHLEDSTNLREDINAVHQEANRRALIQAEVVGITTTTLAHHIETLHRLGTKAIICEEVAEVMEAHVTSALMPGVEHFIQIGVIAN